MFKTYTIVEDKKMLLREPHTNNVVETENMELNFTFRKTIILKDFMHVSEIRKILVFNFILNEARFTRSIGH